MAENKPQIRFGIIGCANIARKVTRAINLAPNSIIHAIASRSIEKAKRFASVNGLDDQRVKIYGSYDQVLEDPSVDAVYMPLPTSLHLHWAVMAAQSGKHVLIEKPTALDVAELDRILEACQSNGVQFMDGSMWLHHPRTGKIKEMLFDSKLLGDVNYIYSTSTTSASSEFLEKDIRVKENLDALGALGDIGWYCLGAVLWVKNYQLPTVVTALPDITKNSNGVIISCSASIQYKDPSSSSTGAKTNAIIHCSFLSDTSMDLAVTGSRGSFNLKDFIIPYRESSASFEFTSGAKFVDLHVGWNVKPEKVVVNCELPQEALMVEEFSRLVEGIRTSGSLPDRKWAEISRKTQMLVDAVKKSVDLGCKPVYF